MTSSRAVQCTVRFDAVLETVRFDADTADPALAGANRDADAVGDVEGGAAGAAVAGVAAEVLAGEK